MDLDRVAAPGSIDCISSVSTEVTRDGDLGVRIGLIMEQGPDVVLVLSGVHRLHLEGDDFSSWVDELIVRRLPRFGPWPPEAHHLILFHSNESEKVWLRLTGPTEIEAVANDLRVEAGRAHSDKSPDELPIRH